MNRKAIPALLLCGLLPLTSCGYVASRSYSSVVPYVEQTADTEDVSILRATTYAELLNCIQYFVTMGETEGTVRLYQYTGDVGEDLETACQEVVQDDPLGTYALSGISYTYQHIVTYYECTVTYTYRRTFDQIASIRTVNGTTEIRAAIASALQSWEEELVLEMSSYYADQDGILSLVQEAYYQNPSYAVEYPSVLVTVYHSTGTKRIVEITFQWTNTQAELQRMTEEVRSTAAAMTSGSVSQDETGVWLLYSRLATIAQFDTESSDSVYDALNGDVVSSHALALAFEVLCDLAGISCETVYGTRDDVPHWWNIVTTEGGSFYVDITEGADEETFRHYDEDLSQRYSWDTQSYPACTAPEDEEADADTDTEQEGETSAASSGAEPEETETVPFPFLP
ncbi:MAG: hypothetical protein LUF84_05580 [Clostridiales bacterium]|nr:hypothetical protein [Clostridiales bacterium]